MLSEFEACMGRHVLAIQHTSEINFTTTKERTRGLGKIGKGSGRGVLLHAMLGADAETAVFRAWLAGRCGRAMAWSRLSQAPMRTA